MRGDTLPRFDHWKQDLISILYIVVSISAVSFLHGVTDGRKPKKRIKEISDSIEIDPTNIYTNDNDNNNKKKKGFTWSWGFN